MNTLIELYDERPIENVLATEVFRPERTVFLCPTDVFSDKTVQQAILRFFEARGIRTEVVFMECSLYNVRKIIRRLEKIAELYPDCAMNISGGTDAALFASGSFCAEHHIPVFTYSRRKNAFYNVSDAEFAEETPCEPDFRIADFFLMAGGAMREGRVDNSVLEPYLPDFDAFFGVYRTYKKQWVRIVTWLQRASQAERGVDAPLNVSSPFRVKGERGNMIDACPAALHAFEEMGWIKNLEIAEGENVSFSFASAQVRAWMRDVGSVLELYTYKACLELGAFRYVYTSAIVDWDGDFKSGNVTNEIDVIAASGLVPVFISCKTCEIKTEAVNELSVLKERFGGKMAKACIISTEGCSAITRRRAEELQISVVDSGDLRAASLRELISGIVKE